MSKTIFERIIAREIPGRFVYEDDVIAAFHDVKPAAPVHVLVVPKKPIAGLASVTAGDAAILGHLLAKVPEIAAKLGLDGSGYRVAINSGRDAGETVPHLHAHILGGRPMGWPPG
jgi:histidine triad (HIT) family protein